MNSLLYNWQYTTTTTSQVPTTNARKNTTDMKLTWKPRGMCSDATKVKCLSDCLKDEAWTVIGYIIVTDANYDTIAGSMMADIIT